MLQANIVDDYSTDVKPHQSVLPYSDSISSIAWAPPHLGRVLATTSWDGELRILSLEDSQFGPALFQKFCSKYPYPPLKCCWNDEGTQIYVGLLDGSVNVFDFGGGQGMEVGRHGSAINSLHFVTGMNAVLSAAHEPMAQIWQPHSPTPILSLNAENKIFTSAFQYPMFVAGTANEKILMLDLYSYNSKILIDSSDLGKHSQIQSIALNPKGNICGIGSNDGRTTIMSLIKNVSGLLTHVVRLLLRSLSSPSRATRRKPEASPTSTPSTAWPSTPATKSGS
jgi:WD40 repeat protein